MRLLFLHGWGFAADIWDRVRVLLPPHEAVMWDRGYFGPASLAAAGAPHVAIGHSLGALRLLAAPPTGCRGVVAINGFARFAGDGAVPVRVLDQMRRRFRLAPDAVLAAFRARCGAGPPPPGPVWHRLAADLDALATLDATGHPGPLVALHGAADPILPPAMCALGRRVAGGGHLLPLTHPAECAAAIRAAWR